MGVVQACHPIVIIISFSVAILRFAETSTCPYAACCGQQQEGFGGIFQCVIQHLQHFELDKTPK